MGASVVGAGAILSAYSNMQNMDAQADAERKNIIGYRKQMEDADLVFQRKLHLLKTDQEKYLGSLDSDFAKAGIDFSGSALQIYSQTTQDMAEERAALNAEAYSVKSRFESEIQNAQSRVDALSDPLNRGMTMLGGAFSAAGSSMGRSA